MEMEAAAVSLIGHAHDPALLAYVRQELRRTVLEEGRPRDPVADTGGYGVVFTAAELADLPKTFVDGTNDELCPVLDERWSDFESNEAIGLTAPISPFTDAQMRGGPKSGVLEIGSGYMVLMTSEGDSEAETTVASGLGRRGTVSVSSPIRIEVNIPKGRGTDQGQLYASLLALIFKDRRVDINDDAYLWQLGGEPPQRIDFDTAAPAWTRGEWEGPAERIQNAPSAIAAQ